MAIFGLDHTTIGRTTHRAGTAAAHARYITRWRAVSAVIAEHMPTDPQLVQQWLLDQEEGDRKNARVVDKVLFFLPIELGPPQWQKMLRKFFYHVGGGRAAWLVGIHAKGKDRKNPHAHGMFRDRDIETGKRVAQLSEKGSTERLRKLWADIVNEALEEAGESAWVSHRKKSDQRPPKKAKPAPSPVKARKQKYRRNWRERYERRNRKRPAPVIRKRQQDTAPVLSFPLLQSRKGALRSCSNSCASGAAEPPPKGALTSCSSFNSVRGGILPLYPGNPAPANRRPHYPQSFGAPGPPMLG